MATILDLKGWYEHALVHSTFLMWVLATSESTEKCIIWFVFTGSKLGRWGKDQIPFFRAQRANAAGIPFTRRLISELRRYPVEILQEINWSNREVDNYKPRCATECEPIVYDINYFPLKPQQSSWDILLQCWNTRFLNFCSVHMYALLIYFSNGYCPRKPLIELRPTWAIQRRLR